MLDTINKALAAVDYPTQPVGLYEPISYVLGHGGQTLAPYVAAHGLQLVQK